MQKDTPDHRNKNKQHDSGVQPVSSPPANDSPIIRDESEPKSLAESERKIRQLEFFRERVLQICLIITILLGVDVWGSIRPFSESRTLLIISPDQLTKLRGQPSRVVSFHYDSSGISGGYSIADFQTHPLKFRYLPQKPPPAASNGKKCRRPA